MFKSDKYVGTLQIKIFNNWDGIRLDKPVIIIIDIDFIQSYIVWGAFSFKAIIQIASKMV